MDEEIVKKWRDIMDKNAKEKKWPKTVDEEIEQASLELSEEDLEDYKK